MQTDDAGADDALGWKEGQPRLASSDRDLRKLDRSAELSRGPPSPSGTAIRFADSIF